MQPIAVRDCANIVANSECVWTIEPDETAQEVYNDLYELYKELHNGFGNVTPQAAFGNVMKELLALRAWVLA